MIAVGLDYLSVTIRDGSQVGLPPALIDTDYDDAKGRHGYKAARKFYCGAIEYSGADRDSMGSHIVYSGQALSYLQTNYNYHYDLLKHHVDAGHKVSRLDIKVDMLETGIDIGHLFSLYGDRKVKTRSRSKASGIVKSDGRMETLYIGSVKTRRKLLRIYNKAVERGISDMDWVRVELETRQQNAERAASYINDANDKSAAIISLIRGFCDFETYSIWTDAMESEPCSLPTGVDKSDGTLAWINKSVVPAIARQALKDERFLGSFLESVAAAMDDLRSKPRS